MNVTIQQGGIQNVSAEAIIVNLFRGVTEPKGATGVIDEALGGAISELIELGDLRGKLGETVMLYPRGLLSARRVIVVGLGEAETFDLEAVREAAGAAARRAQDVGATSVATIIHGGGIGGLEIGDAAQAVVEGSLLALYRYESPLRQNHNNHDDNDNDDDDNNNNNGDEQGDDVEQLTLVEFDESKIEAIEAGARAGEIIADSVALARTLINEPPNIATPGHLAHTAQAVAAETGLTCEVWDEAMLREQGMGAFLAVAQGATEPPRFIIMRYTPPDPDQAGQKPVILVGKGVTFDTGGYSLKGKQGMVGMKADMGGAAAVIGALRAVALLHLPLPVIGLVPSAENMVNAMAYKPNDVFVAKNGTSIEIISTDAEGRMLLADALCYADSLEPAAVIDVATLTGGKVVALGERMSGLFCADDKLADKLQQAGAQVGEPLWPLPLDPAYDRQLESDVADLKNAGGRAASAITAARFLAHFTGDWPWAHLDVAGGVLYDGGPTQTRRSYLTQGGTAIPLRTLVEALRGWDEG